MPQQEHNLGAGGVFTLNGVVVAYPNIKDTTKKAKPGQACNEVASAPLRVGNRGGLAQLGAGGVGAFSGGAIAHANIEDIVKECQAG